MILRILPLKSIPNSKYGLIEKIEKVSTTAAKRELIIFFLSLYLFYSYLSLLRIICIKQRIKKCYHLKLFVFKSRKIGMTKNAFKLTYLKII